MEIFKSMFVDNGYDNAEDERSERMVIEYLSSSPFTHPHFSYTAQPTLDASLMLGSAEYTSAA